MSIKMATFSGVAFAEVGRQSTTRQYSVAHSVRHIPGGDRNYIDLSGRTHTTVQIPMFFEDNAEFQAFDALTGVQGSLSVHSGTFSALLVSLTSNELIPDGGQYATGNFILT